MFWNTIGAEGPLTYYQLKVKGVHFYALDRRVGPCSFAQLVVKDFSWLLYRYAQYAGRIKVYCSSEKWSSDEYFRAFVVSFLLGKLQESFCTIIHFSQALEFFRCYCNGYILSITTVGISFIVWFNGLIVTDLTSSYKLCLTLQEYRLENLSIV